MRNRTKLTQVHRSATHNRGAMELLLIAVLVPFLLGSGAAMEPLPQSADGTGTKPSGAPQFAGATNIVPTTDGVFVRWVPAIVATDPGALCRYHIYVAHEPREQNYDRPRLTTDPGATSARVRGLPVGRPTYVVVRAVDPSGKVDDNHFEWCATPNPIIYVDAAAAPGGDGTTPERPLRTLDAAIGRTIDRTGVTIYVAGGEYSEEVFLFEGTQVYGGFRTGFDVEQWPSVETTLRSRSRGDLVVVAPGKMPCALHNVALDGAGVGRRGVVGDDCVLHLGAVTVRNFLDKGIELRSGKDDDAAVSVVIRQCRIEKNKGEGLGVGGTAQVVLSHVHVVANGEEGVEVEPLRPSASHKARLKMEECTIADNGDLGIEVEIAPTVAATANQTGRVRVTIRDCQVLRNGDHGIAIDVPPGSSSDTKVKLERNTAAGNAGVGVQVECDVPIELEYTKHTFKSNGVGDVMVAGEASALAELLPRCSLAGISRISAKPNFEAAEEIRVRFEPSVAGKGVDLRTYESGGVARARHEAIDSETAAGTELGLAWASALSQKRRIAEIRARVGELGWDLSLMFRLSATAGGK